MTLARLKQMIRCAEFSKREQLTHDMEERLGMLCEANEPTEEQLQIVHDQLFPPVQQKEMSL